jgi:hypothetical protein
MGLTMRERHAIIRELAPAYRRAASKKERSRIIDQCVTITGYTRSHTAFALRYCGKAVVRVVGGQRIIFVPGHAKPMGASRQRACRYESPVLLEALTFFWSVSDGLCGKRLSSFIGATLPTLERDGALPWLTKEPAVRGLLEQISPATIDRLLAGVKARTQLKGRSTTRPGTLLKHHIPIRTFADWNEGTPGFCEVDLVAHDGGSPSGEYLQSLNLVDVATSWTEAIAVQNKAERHVFAGLREIRQRLPFALLGIDSDNGSEFINHELVRYCATEQITFTRSRPYRKNDNCFVEQKNYSVVRKAAAYYRYDTAEQLGLLNELYALLRLFTNFFQPVMKLREKTRTGSRVTRRYDTPRTPFQRLLDHPGTSQQVKEALSRQYAQLQLVGLKRSINGLQARLFATAIDHRPPTVRPGHPAPTHPWRKSMPAFLLRRSPAGEKLATGPATTEPRPLPPNELDSKE